MAYFQGWGKPGLRFNNISAEFIWLYIKEAILTIYLLFIISLKSVKNLVWMNCCTLFKASKLPESWARLSNQFHFVITKR